MEFADENRKPCCFIRSASSWFPDIAFTPHLLTTAAKKNHAEEEIVILTATSGDTGKAALAGFADGCRRLLRRVPCALKNKLHIFSPSAANLPVL